MTIFSNTDTNGRRASPPQSTGTGLLPLVRFLFWKGVKVSGIRNVKPCRFSRKPAEIHTRIHTQPGKIKESEWETNGRHFFPKNIQFIVGGSSSNRTVQP